MATIVAALLPNAHAWRRINQHFPSSAGDVEDQHALIRSALNIGLGAVGELIRLRAAIDSARQRRPLDLPAELEPRDTYFGEHAEVIAGFAEALSMLDALRASGLQTVAACDALRTVQGQR